MLLHDLRLEIGVLIVVVVIGLICVLVIPWTLLGATVAATTLIPSALVLAMRIASRVGLLIRSFMILIVAWAWVALRALAVLVVRLQVLVSGLLMAAVGSLGVSVPRVGLASVVLHILGRGDSFAIGWFVVIHDN